jgi:hypothetical protein
MGLSPHEQHSIITYDIIKANPDKPWSWRFFSLNTNVTWEFVESHPEIPWDFDLLTMNPNITLAIINGNPGKGWCMYKCLQKLEWKALNALNALDALDALDALEDLHALHALYAFDASNTDAIVANILCNAYIFNVDTEMHPFVKAATLIQCAWRNAIANPEMLICKKRLWREHNECFSRS